MVDPVPIDAATTAAEFIPSSRSLRTLADAAQSCRGCPLYKRATQAVFGIGEKSARLMLIGEQPGDQEDLQGAPFVGPAGKLLDECLEEAGIDRTDTYMTNAVKHFKHETRGKRRLHKKPSAREVNACRPWLERELEIVQPRVVLCLGATAAKALLGSTFRITRQRGEWLESEWSELTMATFHPSAVLRVPTSEDRQRMRDTLVHDLKLASERAAEDAG